MSKLDVIKAFAEALSASSLSSSCIPGTILTPISVYADIVMDGVDSGTIDSEIVIDDFLQINIDKGEDGETETER